MSKSKLVLGGIRSIKKFAKKKLRKKRRQNSLNFYSNYNLKKIPKSDPDSKWLANKFNKKLRRSKKRQNMSRQSSGTYDPYKDLSQKPKGMYSLSKTKPISSEGVVLVKKLKGGYRVNNYGANVTSTKDVKSAMKTFKDEIIENKYQTGKIK